MKNTFGPSFFVALKPSFSISTSGHYYNANEASAQKFIDSNNRHISHANTATEETLVIWFYLLLFLCEASG